jgi:hypothetical protein
VVSDRSGHETECDKKLAELAWGLVTDALVLVSSEGGTFRIVSIAYSCCVTGDMPGQPWRDITHFIDGYTQQYGQEDFQDDHSVLRTTRRDKNNFTGARPGRGRLLDCRFS